MYRLLAEGFGLGLSLGMSCISTCAPVYLPFLLNEERKLGKSMLLVLEISAGRFFAYLLFGAVVGMLGQQIGNVNRELFTSIADLLIAIFLIIAAIRTQRQHKGCPALKFTRFSDNAFLLGIVTGINFCPGFLGSLSLAMASGGAIGGMVLFFGFFLGTSIFVMPLGFAGMLTRMKHLVLIGRIASLCVAVWFVFIGVRGLARLYQAQQAQENGRRIEVLAPGQSLTVITTDSLAFRELRDSLTVITGTKVQILAPNALPTFSSQYHPVVFVDARVAVSYSNALKDFDCITVDPMYPVPEIISFLRSHLFLSEEPFRWEFSNHPPKELP